MSDLPINLDSTYADDPGDPSVKAHQEHHDKIHKSLRVYESSLASSYTLADHVMRQVLKGSFTPTGTEAWVHIDWAGQINGVAHVATAFAWNDSVAVGDDLLTGEGFLGTPYVTNTSYTMIGPASGPATTGQSRRFKITGLTAGQAVQWEVDMGATGYYEEYAFTAGAFPIDVVMSIDNKSVYVSLFSENKVVVLNPGNDWSSAGVISQQGELTGHSGAYGLCVHPTDANKVYIARYSANQVVEVDPRTNQVLQTFSITRPYFMVCDGTYLFVVRQEDDQVVRITLSGGAQQAFTVQDGPGYPVELGAYVYVANSVTGSVSRLTKTSAGTVTNLSGFTTPVNLAPNPSGTRLWVLEKNGTSPRARPIDVSTFTIAAATGDDATITGVAGSATGNYLMVSSTGRSAIILAGGSGIADLNTFVLPSEGVLYESSEETTGGLTRGVLSDEGDIFAIEVAANGSLHHWHAAKVVIDPADDFWAGHLDVVVEGVT